MNLRDGELLVGLDGQLLAIEDVGEELAAAERVGVRQILERCVLSELTASGAILPRNPEQQLTLPQRQPECQAWTAFS